ncbi:MAG: glutamate-1-semialdehyde 2,1-aminomutase [Rikenellaceae bacterium]|jgi:glutamate-1-semialdehyde 2,1-aminomutase|nr:glutamate-1-semialdehyde 2,1-aminomutase [Rikenellaceae bacterium]
MIRTASERAYKEALKFIPGGVDSPVRALRAVGETPLFIRRAYGVTLTDLDDNEFTDYCLSWGVFILGHGQRHVRRAVRRAVEAGTSYGISCEGETALAEAVCRRFPSMERVRFVNSGTEAVMSAVRLARGFTGRDLAVKFDGCYHGHVDHLLVAAGSGAVGLPGASSAGVPADFVKHTVSVPFNDPAAVQQLFEQRGSEIAALVVEPVPANMGVVPPAEGFLKLLRDLTVVHGALLIFDEVISGLRLSDGGAQKLSNVTPDLTTLGKIVGGGFPAAAFGGRADVMSLLAPDGPVYQAGTLSGNPVAMAAGLATLRQLERPGFYERLQRKCENFYADLRSVIAGRGLTLNTAGSMFTLFFGDAPVASFTDAKRCDTKRFASYFRGMLSDGIYVSPSQFEASFVSEAHTPGQLATFVEAVAKNI